MLLKTVRETLSRILSPRPEAARANSKSIENPSVPLADADVWGADSWQSAAGETVTPQSAMKLAAFWQAVFLIAGDLAKLPLEVFAHRGDDRAVDETHPAHWLVKYEPNAEQTAFEFWNDFFASLLVFRNAYAWIRRDANRMPTGLYQLLSDRTEPEIVDGRKVYFSEIDGRIESFAAEDILHVRAASFGGGVGLDLVYYARDVLGKALARQNCASQLFARGLRVGGILELPKAPKDIQDKVEAGFRSTYEQNDNAFATMVLKDGAKFHAAQSTFRDAQMMEVGLEDIREIARLFNCPPHKLGDKTSANYNTLEQENQSYFDSTLSPHMANVKQSCRRRLLSLPCRNAGCHHFDYNVGALHWADVKTVADVGNSGILAGWLERNTVRRWFNLPAVAGGDVLLVPVNMQPIAGGDPPADPPAEGDRSNPPRRRRRRRKLPTARDCSPRWIRPDDGPAPLLRLGPTATLLPALSAGDNSHPPRLPAPAAAAEATALRSLGDVVLTLIADARGRFVKRLTIAAARSLKNSQRVAQFTADELEGHLTVGREMFEPAQAARALVDSTPRDFAAELVESLRAAIAAGDVVDAATLEAWAAAVRERSAERDAVERRLAEIAAAAATPQKPAENANP